MRNREVKKPLDPDTTRIPRLDDYADEGYNEFEEDDEFLDWDESDDDYFRTEKETDNSEPEMNDYRETPDEEVPDEDPWEEEDRKPEPPIYEKDDYEDFREPYMPENETMEPIAGSHGFAWFLGHELLFSIPVIGLIIALVFALTGKEEKKTFARSFIIYIVVMVLILSAVVLVFYK